MTRQHGRAVMASVAAMCLLAGTAWAQASGQPAKVDPAKPVKVEPGKLKVEPPAKPGVGAPDPKEMEAMMKAMTPGEHHKHLAKFVGHWTGTVKMWMAPGQTPMESPTECTSKMELDGRYLHSHYTGDFMGQKFTGIGVIGYNNTTKQYESSWIDNMGTGVETSTGTCDAGKTFTFTGEMTNPMEGKKVKSREVMKWTDDNGYTQEFFTPGPDGKEFKNMEITFHRAAEGEAKKELKDEIKDKAKDELKKVKLPEKK